MVESKKQKPRSTTYDAILQAACRVLAQKGLEALTLDAVAQEAEVSKGGLLYHFPNKDALIVGLVNYVSDEFDTTWQEEFEQDDAPGTPGQWTRAYVRATLRFDKQLLALIADMLKAAKTMPDVLEAARGADMRWRQRILSDGLNLVQATIVQLAIDGLWFAEVLQMAPEEPLRTQVIEALVAMTRAPK
jgi:AcrR family transcriptional regulator